MDYQYMLDYDLELEKTQDASLTSGLFGPLDCSFLRQIQNGLVPDCEPPYLNWYYGREFCVKRGMWAIVNTVWTAKLADWIGRRSALEIMAGRGWLAKALSLHGVDIVATDDYSWDDTHNMCRPVCSVDKMDAKTAVLAHADREVLICSWPHGTQPFLDIAREWITDGGVVVYIGESPGGCCVDENWNLPLRKIEVGFPSWHYIYDRVYEVR